MGHRANFVLIRDGRASAYYDQWAALGSTYAFADGAGAAVSAAEMCRTTDKLLDWAFAEAGYLLDFDEKQAIVFGYPGDVEFELEDLGDAPSSDAPGAGTEINEALEKGPLEFLRLIAPKWPGWLLHWDDRGVDAFAAHLARRGITSPAAQPASHPADRTVASLQA